MECKKVTYKNLKVGQKIEGTEGDGCTRFFTAYVKYINASYVTVEMREKGGHEERIDSSLMFMVEITEEEFNMRYREKAREVLKGFQNVLHGDEIGSHEMWNSWLCGTPYEIAKYCIDNDMMVVGYSTDIIPKTAMFSGDTLDAGVCAEYSDGDRIWCHYRTEDIRSMLEEYRELLEV